jgi:glycosyltransferase involved in cell wall biosynthesis
MEEGMSAPFFSVIIPTFNRRDGLRDILHSLSCQKGFPGGFEVIVVVDGSTDGTVEMLRDVTMPYPLSLIEQDNGGASTARNAGAALARGEYIALTEDDVIPASDWLSTAYTLLVTRNLDILEGRTEYQGTGGSVRRFEPPGIPSFIPCNLFIRRSSFAAAGGYESGFFDRDAGLYFREDADLGFRLLDMGFSMYIASDVRVAHPLQFSTLRAALRHAQRYRFDPLLYKRHPRRYREFIEVKHIAGVTVRRPQHYVALGGACGLAAMIAGFSLNAPLAWAGGAAMVLLSGILFRYKYHGARAFSPREVATTLAFIAVPFVYLAALLRGCVRYRTIGVLW